MPNEATSDNSNPPKPLRPSPVIRACLSLVLVAALGLLLVLALGRPETAPFTVDFKCTRLGLGAPADLDLSGCDLATFRANTVDLPVDAYYQFEEPPDLPDDIRDKGKLPIRVVEQRPVKAEIDDNYRSSVMVHLGPDGIIEIPAWRTSDKHAELRFSSENMRLTLLSFVITLNTPCDPDFYGFSDGIKEEFSGKISLDGNYNSQGGVPDTVTAEVSALEGPVGVRGKIDEVGGWTPLNRDSATAIKIADAVFWAENITGCALSIGGKPTDIDSSLDRLQIDASNATVTSLSVYQDSAERYVRVEVTGTARSVKDHNKERIEATLSELLAQPSYKTGIKGMLLVFVIFAAGIVLKRALELLAKLWLPD